MKPVFLIFACVLARVHVFSAEPEPSSPNLPSWCYDPPGTDCSWYKECLVRRHSCEAVNTSYAIGFGDAICNEFSRNRADFTEMGQTWIDNTRACLQKQLVEVLDVNNTMTCAEIQTFAFKSHEHCYRDAPLGAPSFCDLSFSDWLRITWIVKDSFMRETSQTFKQVALILGGCASRGLTSLFG